MPVNLVRSDLVEQTPAQLVADATMRTVRPLGRTDGSSPGVGEIGETITTGNLTTGQTFVSPTMGAWNDVTAATITLSTGPWAIYANVPLYIQLSSGPSGANALASIRQGSTVIAGVVGAMAVIGVSSSRSWGGAFLSAIVNVSGSTVYKLSILAQELNGGEVASSMIFNAGADTPGILYAIRIA